MAKLNVFLSPVLVDYSPSSYSKYVVIDLFRATTAFCTALHYGAKEIMPFTDIESTRMMKDKGYLIAGERNGYKLDGFDFGNSPYDFMTESLKGRSIAFTTTNGTACIEKVKDKGQTVIASLNNLSAVVKYLTDSPEDTAIVCSGWKNQPNLEDSICAGALCRSLLNNGYTADDDSVSVCTELFDKSQENIYQYLMDKSGRIAARANLLERDFKKCLERDLYDVVPVLNKTKIINIM